MTEHTIEPTPRQWPLLPTLSYTGDQIFKIIQTEPMIGMPSCATVTMTYQARPRDERHSGPGVYACFWDGGLFYVGTFAGNREPQLGHVAKERWGKHIAGMTLRGHRLSIARRWLRRIANDHRGPLAELIVAADPTILARDKGLQTQYSKFRFAERYWSHFEKLDDVMLGQFSFVYVRPSLEGRLAGISKATLDGHLRQIEQKAIDRLEPPCNSKSRRIDGAVTANPEKAETEIRTIMSNHFGAFA